MAFQPRPTPYNHNHVTNYYHNSANYNHNQNKQSKQLMSFQNYVRTLSNNIDENTACKKYKEFMANLSQSKVGRFFDENKDREWFKVKYHPVDSKRYLQNQNINFMKRLKFFNDLNDRNYFESLRYCISHASSILNLMDATIVHLEDGPESLVDKLLSSDNADIDKDLREQFIPNKPISVVIDNISIETTMSELHDICIAASPDLLRLTQLDPYYVDGGVLRRKVVAIYKSNVDIKEVCWILSKTKLNDKPLNVYINKNIQQRIHSTDALYSNNLCVINDIRTAIILILNFDRFKGLYGKRKQFLENSLSEVKKDVTIKMEVCSQDDNGGDVIDSVAPLSPPGSDKSMNDEEPDKPFDASSLDEDREKEKKKLYEFKFTTDLSPYRLSNKLDKSKNPLLENAYIYFVEVVESSSAVHQLARVPPELNSNPPESLDASDKISMLSLIAANLPFSDEQNMKYLDKLLWYLRIVHSFDFYKKALYRQEDELTLRMSVIHLRDALVREEANIDQLKDFIAKCDREFEEFGLSLSQKYVTKDEERFNYKSYGKVITDELTSYAQKIQKAKSTEMEEVYKCKHCTKVFQKLVDIGRHFVSKHRWAIDAIEVETDFFNAYLFDVHKINPVPPKELIEKPPNRFAIINNLSERGEDPDTLKQTIEAYNKMESFVREPAPRAQTASDPRNETIVEYDDVSFDDAI